MNPNRRFLLKDVFAGGALPTGPVLPHASPADRERRACAVQAVASGRRNALRSRP